MKKVIFKGTINGKQFDNVQAYNEEMNRLMSAGENVQAESHTEAIEVCDECKNEQCKCDDIDWLPGFNDYEEYYLDDLVSGDNAKDKALYNEWKEALGKSQEAIAGKLPSMTNQELEEYKADLKDVLACIEEDSADNANAMKELQLKLNTCKNAEKIINLSRDWYTDMIKFVQSHIDFLYDKDHKECKCEDGCSTNCNCKEKQSQKVSNAFEDLYRLIFG